MFCLLYIGKTCCLTGYANKQFEFEFEKKKNFVIYLRQHNFLREVEIIALSQRSRSNQLSSKYGMLQRPFLSYFRYISFNCHII